MNEESKTNNKTSEPGSSEATGAEEKDALTTSWTKLWQAVKQHRWKAAIVSLVSIAAVALSIYEGANQYSKYLLNKDLRIVLKEVCVLWLPGKPPEMTDHGHKALLAVLTKHREELKENKKVYPEYLVKLGNVYVGLARESEAKHYYEAALKQAKDHEDDINEAAARANLAALELNKETGGNLDKAIERAGGALLIHERKHMIEEQANDYFVLGKIYFRKKSFLFALRTLKEAAQLYSRQQATGRLADTKSVMGRVQRKMGETSKALSYLKDAKKLHVEAADRRGEAHDLVEMGKIQYELGDRKAALRHFQEARKIFAELSSETEEATTLFEMGRMYQEIGEPDQALTSLRRAEDLKRKQERGKEARNLYYIGVVYNEKGSSDMGIEFMQRALTISKGIKDRKLQAKALQSIGLALKKKGDYDTAMQYLEDARAAHNRNNDKIGEARDIAEIGFLQLDTGKRREAQSELEKALRSFREEGDRTGEALALGYLGLLYLEQGDLYKARKAAWIAKSIHDEQRHPKGQALQLVRLARIYRQEPNYRLAVDLLMKAQRIYVDHPHDLGQAKLNMALGLVYKDQSKWREALACFRKAHEVFERETGDPKEDASVKSEMAMVRRKLGDRGRSPLSELREALKIHRQIGFKAGEATIRGYIGQLLLAEGELDSALRESSAAHRFYARNDNVKGMAAMGIQIGLIQLKKRKLQEAEKRFRKAVHVYHEAFDWRREASAWTFLGLAMHAQKNTDDAHRCWEKGQKLGSQHSCRKTRALVLTCRGAASIVGGASGEGLEYLDKAAILGEDFVPRSEDVALFFSPNTWSVPAGAGKTVPRPSFCEDTEQLRETAKAHHPWTREIVQAICKSCGSGTGSELNSGRGKSDLCQ